MGFLDNLLKNKTRKIISNMVDSVVDNVVDSVKGAIQGNDAEIKSTSTVSVKDNGQTVTAKNRENETGDDAHCEGSKSTICRRIEMAAAENWPGYELRRNISAAELGADKKAHSFDYGLYLNGQPKVMIMILKQHQYRNENVLQAHKACKRNGVGSFHLLMHLPNRKTYIAERIKAVMPF